MRQLLRLRRLPRFTYVREAKMSRARIIKNYIVDKEFQVAYILRNLLLLALIVVSVAVIFIAWNHFQVRQGFLIRPPSGEQVISWAKANNVSQDSGMFAYQFMTQAKAYTFFDLLWKPLTLVLLGNLIILTFTGIYFSYKIAGPIYHMKNLLRDKIAGKPVTRLQFRKSDPFHELSDLVNQAMDLTKKNDQFAKQDSNKV
jgi:hypothetical protein